MIKFSKGLLFLIAASAVGMTSCSDDNPWSGSDEEGGINLNFTADGRVMRNTRADDSVSPVVPDGNSFKVTLSKTDGSYSKDWSSVDAFNREASFPIGDYNISASYGDVDVEGFENPCFTGTAPAHVSPGSLTDVNLTATLANAMVSIRYTDQFIANFQAYSAAVQTEGHDWVVFAQNEDRPAYISPSEVRLNLTLTNRAGERVTIQPAGFTARARHHYVVTIGVTGNVESGNLALDVVFDEDVVAETVKVSLGDDLFSAPAPSVKANGFTPDTAVELFESANPANPVKFDVFAFGGLASATLDISSDTGYEPSFGKSVSLVNADALTQSQLAAAGVDCAGFFRNVDKMGVVDLTKFLSKVPVGNYTINLQVVDAMTRTSEPLTLKANVKAVELSLDAPVTASFLDTEISVDVLTNCLDIKNNVSFKAPDADNRLVPVTIKSVTEVSGASPAPRHTRADLPYRLRYVLEVAPVTGNHVDVEATLGNKKRTISVPANTPEVTITPDAYARKVVLKIEGSSQEATEYLRDNLKFYNGDTQIPSPNIKHDASTGLITILGLTPNVRYVALRGVLGSLSQAVPEFITESETALNNGNLDGTSETININPVNVGGKYRVSPVDYQITSSIVRSTPVGWANVNENTCWSGSSNKNTWYLVPSTFSVGGTALLRSVGYSHNGPDIARSGGAFNTKYYCENAPSESSLEKAAGELFLGSYSFNGSESRTDGIEWSSRPLGFSFSYKYTPRNGEQAEAYLKVLDASGNVIAEKVLYLNASADMQEVSAAVPAYPFGKRASKLQLGFRSTKNGVVPSINIPKGSALDEGEGLGNKKKSANNYKAFASGSELVIDNVSLSYDPSFANGASVRTRKRK